MDDKFNVGATVEKPVSAAIGGLVLGVMVFWAFIKEFLFLGFVFGAFLFLAGILFALFGTITSVVVAVFRRLFKRNSEDKGVRSW